MSQLSMIEESTFDQRGVSPMRRQGMIIKGTIGRSLQDLWHKMDQFSSIMYGIAKGICPVAESDCR